MINQLYDKEMQKGKKFSFFNESSKKDMKRRGKRIKEEKIETREIVGKRQREREKEKRCERT